MKRRSTRSKAVTVLVSVITIIGLAEVATAAAESAPAAPADAVAGSMASVTGVQLDRAARSLGFDTASSPSAAWISSCLAARGVRSTYDDANGSFTVEGDGPELLECTKELATKSAG